MSGNRSETCTLEVVEWQGRLHCVYLNDHRIAGGKPWAGGQTVRKWNVALSDLRRAVPSLSTALPHEETGE